MTWDYWICLYTQTHSVARGLRPKTIAAYEATLQQFRGWMRLRYSDSGPGEVSARQVLEYVEYLRRERRNGDSAVNRQVTVLRSFYRAMVAMAHMDERQNPMALFPKIKSAPRKLPVVLTEDEVGRLLDSPPTDTVVGLRDRAMLSLLYGTGIRASECAGLGDSDVDLEDAAVQVTGKGGHQRTVPLNESVVEALTAYRQARGPAAPGEPFFRSRSGRAMSRGAVYERVRRYGRLARLPKRVTPHRLRHTFATHLVQAEVGLVTIRDLLGHQSISSTQIYLHLTARDLQAAVERHPIRRLAPIVERLLPEVRLPWQRRCAPRRSG